MKKESLTQRIKQYDEQANALKTNNSAIHQLLNVSKDYTLAIISNRQLLFTAAVLPVLSSLPTNPAFAQGNCYTNAVHNSAPVPNNGGAGNGLPIDIDGGGADFSIFEGGPVGNQGSLFIRALSGGIAIFRTPNYTGASANAKNFNSDAAIPGVFNANNHPTLFLRYGAAQGQWPTAATSGFIGFSKGGNNGFIKLTLDDASSDPFRITVEDRGVAAQSGAITANCNSLLPVELISFTTKTTSNQISLYWQTASETNNAGFEVQRSTDGKNFQNLTWIEGKGTTTEQQDYVYDDKDLKKGQRYYYRLKQIDYDGQFEYSKVINARLESTGISGTFSPNPTLNGLTQLDYIAIEAGKLDIQWFDASGKELMRQTYDAQKGDNRFELDASQLGTGMFFVKMKQGEHTAYDKLVIK